MEQDAQMRALLMRAQDEDDDRPIGPLVDVALRYAERQSGPSARLVALLRNASDAAREHDDRFGRGDEYTERAPRWVSRSRNPDVLDEH